jgi:hypothetical protein
MECFVLQFTQRLPAVIFGDSPGLPAGDTGNFPCPLLDQFRGDDAHTRSMPLYPSSTIFPLFIR